MTSLPNPFTRAPLPSSKSPLRYRPMSKTTSKTMSKTMSETATLPITPVRREAV